MPRYLCWAVGATALHAAVPDGTARAAVGLGLSLAASGAAVWAIRRWRPHPSLPWWLLAATLAAAAMGDLARLASTVAPPQARVGADLGTALLAGATAVAFLVVRSPGRSWQALVDAAVVVLAPALLVLTAPADGLLDTGVGVSLAITASLAAMIAAGVALRFDGRRRPASLLLLLAATGVALAEHLAALATMAVHPPGVTPVSAAGATLGGWGGTAGVMSVALAASAALHPSMIRMVEPVAAEQLMGLVRLGLLWLVLLASPAVALTHALGGGWQAAAATVGVGLLHVGVLARIGALLAERENARAAARASDQRFRALVQHAFDVIAVVDAEGVIAYISPSAEQVLGHGPAWWVGRPLDDLVGVEDVEVLRDALAVARHTPPAASRAEVRLVHAGTETRWGDVLLADRLDDPSVRGVVVNLRDVTERKQAELELSRLALHDALTGLPNRVRFLERVARALDHGGRRQDGTAVLFCDLDGFKAVNDRYGHDLGDRLLRAVAERLREALREHDEPARLGGDEFVVLCRGVDSTQAEAIAQRLRVALAEPFVLHGRELRVGCSIGIANADLPGLLPEELLAAADHAMYRAKRLGTGVAVHRWGHPNLPDPLLVDVDLPLHPSPLGS